MLSIGKDLILSWKISTSRVDQINTRQAIVFRDGLGSQMFFDGNRVVSASLDGSVIDHQHAVLPMNLPDTGDDAPAGDLIIVKLPTGKLRQFQKPSARVEQFFDSLARQQLASCAVSGPGFFTAPLRHPLDGFSEHSGFRQHCLAVGQKIGRGRINAAGELDHDGSGRRGLPAAAGKPLVDLLQAVSSPESFGIHDDKG